MLYSFFLITKIVGCSSAFRPRYPTIYYRTFFLTELSSLLTHYVAAPFKPGPTSLGSGFVFFNCKVRFAPTLSISRGIESTIRSAPLFLLSKPKPPDRLRFGFGAGTWQMCVGGRKMIRAYLFGEIGTVYRYRQSGSAL